MKRFKDVLVVGFALFAMFLGAGNLIFPPTLGHISGDRWMIAIFGFMLTGIGLPLMGIVAAAKAGGRTKDVAKYLGEKPAMFLNLIIIVCIGPLLAIPRTAAVTYELGIKPLFPSVSPILSAIVFFLITLYFTLGANSVIDKVGAILTPILLIVLAIIIVVGVIQPVGIPVDTQTSKNFLRGFEEGYQTMDALASLVFATIILKSISDKGYKDMKEQSRITVVAGLIAATGLLLVYGGFGYLGASSSGVFSADLSRAELLIAIIQRLLGKSGSIILSLAVSLACLTTAVGLTATAGEFFSSNFKSISYKIAVYTISAFSAFFAINGVDTIISFAVPILTVLYPLAIVLILMTLVDDKIHYKSAYKGACLGAFLMALVQNFLAAENLINSFLERLQVSPFFANMSPLSVNFDTPIAIIEKLPLAGQGFAWILPAASLGIIFALVEKYKKEV